MNKKWTRPYIYFGHDGYGSYFVRGYITVVEPATIDEQVVQNTIQNNTGSDPKEFQWHEFTNDLEQFSVEYPGTWKTMVGNRFTGGPPLTVENKVSNPNLVASKIQIKVFDSVMILHLRSGLSSRKSS
jgi:hypothetical protein